MFKSVAAYISTKKEHPQSLDPQGSAGFVLLFPLWVEVYHLDI